MKDFGYLYNLIISLATRIKGSVVQRVESLDSIFKDKYDLIEFFDKAGDSAPQKLSDMGFSVVSTETNKMPGRETYAIFFNLYSGGQKVKSSSTNLAGLKEGQRPDGTHASDDQIFEAPKELLG